MGKIKRDTEGQRKLSIIARYNDKNAEDNHPALIDFVEKLYTEEGMKDKAIITAAMSALYRDYNDGKPITHDISTAHVTKSLVELIKKVSSGIDRMLSIQAAIQEGGVMSHAHREELLGINNDIKTRGAEFGILPEPTAAQYAGGLHITDDDDSEEF